MYNSCYKQSNNVLSQSVCYNVPISLSRRVLSLAGHMTPLSPPGASPATGIPPYTSATFSSPLASMSSSGYASSPMSAGYASSPMSAGYAASPMSAASQSFSGPFTPLSPPSIPSLGPPSGPPPPAGAVLSAPPVGPPTSAFSMSAGYDITRGHGGRTPQTPLMPTFSSPSPMPGEMKIVIPTLPPESVLGVESTPTCLSVYLFCTQNTKIQHQSREDFGHSL